MPIMDEPTLYGLLEQARSYVEEGKSLHAIQVYRQLITASPGLAEPWVELFKVYCQLQSFDSAGKLLLESLEFVAEKKEIIFLLGVLHLQTHDNHRALTYFRQLQDSETVLDSEFQSRVHFNLGLVYVQMHRWGLAEHHLRKARQLNPEFPKIDEALSEILLRRGHTREVIEILQAALSKDPYSWLGHYLLGIAFSRARQWKSAYEEFVVATDMDPNEPRSWQKCGECLIALRELDQAEHYLRKALELNPKFTDAVVNYGFLYLERGDRIQAGEIFDKVLAVDPSNAGAREGKRIVLHNSKNPTA
jgi:tetratricopeptide (TPR) repeat protein